MIRLLTALLVALVVAGTARADGPVYMHLRASPANMTREACGRKAVAAMVAEKFPYAEVTADGHARGWDDKTAVHIYSFQTPDPEQVMIYIFSASTIDTEALRLRNAIRTPIYEGKDDPKTPTRIVPADGTVPTPPVSICWKTEERAATPLVKHLLPAATIVLEKRGMTTQLQPPFLVLGVGAGGLTTVFVAPASNAVMVKFNTVTMTRGDKPAEKLAEDILSRVLKILYE